LHLFSWVLKDEKRKQVLLESAKNGRILFGVWGIDPAVNISLQFSEAENLITKVGLSYQLTQRGLEYIAKISDELAYKDDYDFLISLGPKITEGMVDNIVGEWE
jgi:hypothetical protein